MSLGIKPKPNIPESSRHVALQRDDIHLRRQESHRSNRPVTLVAALAFILINVVYALPHYLVAKQILRAPNGVYACIDSAINDYQTSSADLVLVGSSVVNSALWTSDNQERSGVPDFFHDHHAYAIEADLRKAGAPHSAFSFAIPGAMVSDVYLIAKRMFVGTRSPKLVVYGVAPRDFADDTLSSESRTPVFERLAGFQDLFGNLYVTNSDDAIDFLLTHISYFYGKRLHEQQKLTKYVKHFCHWQETTAPAQFFNGQADRKTLWRESMQEYAHRYGHFNKAQFEKQKRFLRELLQLAGDRKFRLLLVEMPLSEQNRRLMPSGFYDQYENALHDAAKQFHVSFINSSQLHKFDDSMFLDGVHLNAQGGELFSKVVAEAVMNSRL